MGCLDLLRSAGDITMLASLENAEVINLSGMSKLTGNLDTIVACEELQHFSIENCDKIIGTT